MSRKTVVIVGAGFGGLAAARAFKGADVEVVLIDRTNHHLFQPLLYQVATAALSPSINSLAATTVNDFYLKYVRPDADEKTLMSVARTATIGWGAAQIAVALGAQWVTRSVLDSGLSVLSLAAGPVLGAFLTGVLTTRVRSGAMLGGMAAGAAVLAWIWFTDSYAFTWYALTGALVTGGVALLLSLLPSRTRDARPL